MNDYDLGVQLRRQILTDLERGLASDGRRLQALLGDFCADRQVSLLPALKYLVLSAGFSNAISQQPPLPADGRLQLRLQQELDQVFATAICERMDAVLRGLLGLPASNTTMAATVAAPTHETTVALDRPAAARTAAPEPPRGNGGLVALLSFMAGVLVVGVGGGLTWLWLQSDQVVSNPQLSAPPAKPEEPSQPRADQVTEAPPAAPDLGNAELNRAMASVQQVYSELSLGNIQSARQLFSESAADQFDPSFFRQFQRVSVDELQETSRNGSAINLQGIVTFVYPDGTTQSESRSFTVETSSNPPLITASSFNQVVQGRQ